MTKRCYKAAWSFDDAFVHITRTAAHEFDPDVLSAFRAVREQIRHLGETSGGAVRMHTAPTPGSSSVGGSSLPETWQARDHWRQSAQSTTAGGLEPAVASMAGWHQPALATMAS